MVTEYKDTGSVSILQLFILLSNTAKYPMLLFDLKIIPEGLKTLTIKRKVRSWSNLYCDCILVEPGYSNPLEVFLIEPVLNCPLFDKSFGET